MNARFFVTYETVTHESAESGDSADRGFVTPGNWHDSIADSPVGPAFEPIKNEHAMSLREAINLVSCCEDSGTWFSEVDERMNYRTGESETRSLHPENVTRATYGRIARLLMKESK